jgi:hypothetical protein
MRRMDSQNRRMNRDLVRLELEELRTSENSLRYLCILMMTRT